MTPKRKVTDLLPTEAILISSDAERDAVLKLMDNAGFIWNDGLIISKWTPDDDYNYCLNYKGEGCEGLVVVMEYNSVFMDYKVYPATDFIPTESDEVDVDKFETIDFKLGVFIRSKVDWYESNHDYQIATDTIRCWLDEFLQQEETRNTPNQ